MLNKRSIRPNVVARGFTLIELLVVISIIALLMAILMPSLSKARELAQMVVCKSNQRSIILAAIAYQSDNNKYPRNMGVDTYMDSHGRQRTTGLWPNRIIRDWDNDGDAYAYGDHITDYLGNSVVYDTMICPLARMDKRVYAMNKANFEGGSFVWGYSSYAFYWNYELLPRRAPYHFIGPGCKAARTSKALTSDLCVYSTAIRNGSWAMPHFAKGVNKYNTLAGGVAYEIPWPKPPAKVFNVRLNVGRSDGSVTQFNTKDELVTVDFEGPYRRILKIGIPSWAATKN